MYNVIIGSITFDILDYEIHEGNKKVKIILQSKLFKDFDIKSTDSILDFIIRQDKENIYSYDFNTIEDIKIVHYSNDGNFTKISFYLSLEDESL